MGALRTSSSDIGCLQVSARACSGPVAELTQRLVKELNPAANDRIVALAPGG